MEQTRKAFEQILAESTDETVRAAEEGGLELLDLREQERAEQRRLAESLTDEQRDRIAARREERKRNG